MTAHDISARIVAIRDRVFSGGRPTHDEGVMLLGLEGYHVLELFAAATCLRDHTKARRVHLTSDELTTVCDAVRAIRAELDILPDASLGLLTDALAERLKAAGLNGYHHNVETAPSYYPQVCTTHTFEENVATLRRAKRFGFTVCSGGVLGIGETVDQRVELAEVLSEEDIDRVCLNFFMPIVGTRFADEKPMSPMAILKTIAVFRLFFPSQDVNVCAGREMHLRDVQGMIFLAGASATMVGDYLTQAGRAAEADLQLLRDLGMTW